MVGVCGSGPLGGLGSEGGADWVQVDEDGCPHGLEGCFSSSAVAALAGVVAVDDQAEEPFDAWPCLFEVGEFGWVGELALCGLAEVFAAVDADVAATAWSAALA